MLLVLEPRALRVDPLPIYTKYLRCQSLSSELEAGTLLEIEAEMTYIEGALTNLERSGCHSIPSNFETLSM